jgi:hypothetical protein
VRIHESLAPDREVLEVHSVGQFSEEADLDSGMRMIALEEEAVERLLALGTQEIDLHGWVESTARQGLTNRLERRRRVVDGRAKVTSEKLERDLDGQKGGHLWTRKVRLDPGDGPVGDLDPWSYFDSLVRRSRVELAEGLFEKARPSTFLLEHASDGFSGDICRLNQGSIRELALPDANVASPTSGRRAPSPRVDDQAHSVREPPSLLGVAGLEVANGKYDGGVLLGERLDPVTKVVVARLAEEVGGQPAPKGFGDQVLLRKDPALATGNATIVRPRNFHGASPPTPAAQRWLASPFRPVVEDKNMSLVSRIYG